MVRSIYTQDELANMVSSSWQHIIVANAGLCTMQGWHLEVTPDATTLVIMYLDCDERACTHRIRL